MMHQQGDENKRKVDDISLDDLYKQVVEVDHLVSNKMHWRGAATVSILYN